MTANDLLEETGAALAANKARSFLTVLGIVIGISSVIAMISIGQGAKSSIQDSIESIGANLLQVTPGAQRGVGTQVSSGRGSAQSLTLDDVTAIESLSDVSAVEPETSSRFQVTSKGTNTNTSIVGTTDAYLSVRNVSIDLGSFITSQHEASTAKVAVLGPTVRDDLFGEGVDPTGKTIRINGIQFTVIGVTAAKGGTGFGSQDDMIFVPLSTAQRFLTGDNYLSTISIQATSQKVMSDLQNEVTAVLLANHNIADPAAADFTVLNQADIVATASSVTSTFTTLLAAVAGISLLVGGIGIMNMMLTNVTERTKEIGLRKAIGAKATEINLQFLAEAVMLTFVGGTLGIAMGVIVSLIISATGLTHAAISPASILLAFGVSAAIGILFGYYPARRAAALNPIVALKYE